MCKEIGTFGLRIKQRSKIFIRYPPILNFRVRIRIKFKIRARFRIRIRVRVKDRVLYISIQWRVTSGTFSPWCVKPTTFLLDLYYILLLQCQQQQQQSNK